MILVIGGSGNIGRELVNDLRIAGASFRVLARDRARTFERIAERLARDRTRPGEQKVTGIEIVDGDLARPDSLDRAFDGVDHAFLASSPDLDQAELHHNAYEAARKAGVEHLVRISAVGAGALPGNDLLEMHARSDRELQDSGLGWTILRPHVFMQNTLFFAPEIAASGVFHAPAGAAHIPYIDVADIAAAAAKVLLDPGHMGNLYVLTGPEPLTLTNVATRLADALGKPVRYEEVPPDAAISGLISVGFPEWLARDYVALQLHFESGRDIEVTSTVAALLGRMPRDYGTFAREHAAAFVRA